VLGNPDIACHDQVPDFLESSAHFSSPTVEVRGRCHHATASQTATWTMRGAASTTKSGRWQRSPSTALFAFGYGVETTLPKPKFFVEQA
jgi:hypothetical protein